MHAMKVNEGESRAAEVGSQSRPRESACLRSLILFVDGAAQPVVACGPTSHKFGNHFCTVSAPFFAVSDGGFVDYQRLTTKWEPRWPDDETTAGVRTGSNQSEAIRTQ